MNEKVIDFIKSNWKEIVIGFLIILLIGVSYYEYKKHEAVPMTTIQENTITEVTKAIDELDIGDKVTPKELQKSIDKAIQSTPQKTFVTSTQKEADTQANTIAKNDKADAIVKQTQTTNSTSNGIVNNYYGLHLTKQHEISVGVSVIESKTYLNVGYKNNKNQYIVQYSPASGKYGATYMRVVSQW